MMENNFTHEKLNILMNSPKYQRVFQSKPAVKNYLKSLDELIISLEDFGKVCPGFMDKLNACCVNIENIEVNIYGNIKILNKSCYDMNTVIQEFNEAISKLNKEIYNFYNFDELSFSEIMYYMQYFNIDIDIQNMIKFYSRNIYLLNYYQMDKLNNIVNPPFNGLDADLINDFINIPQSNRYFYIPYVYYIHVDISPIDRLKKIIQRYDTISRYALPPRNIYFINNDSVEYISLIPGFNSTWANKVIEARKRSIVFKNMDELLDYLSLKPCIGFILNCYISFEKYEYDMWMRFLKNKNNENSDSSFSNDDDILINVTGTPFYHGLIPFKKGTLLNIIPDPENEHDPDAIRVETDYYGAVGYVANSPKTAIKPTKSASEIKDIIKNPQKAEVLFIYDEKYVISKLLFD